MYTPKKFNDKLLNHRDLVGTYTLQAKVSTYWYANNKYKHLCFKLKAVFRDLACGTYQLNFSEW